MTIGKMYAQALLDGCSTLAELEKIIHGIPEQVGPVVEAVRRHVLAMPMAELIAALNARLLEHGWFLPPSLAEEELREALTIADGSSEAVIQWLLDLGERSLTATIAQRAISHEAFRGRRRALAEALAAHRAGRYFLSVPVFLAQAEGAFIESIDSLIDYEQPRTSLFSKEAKTGSALLELAELLRVSDPIKANHFFAFAEALQRELSASMRVDRVAPCSSRGLQAGSLSRHAVMHGIDKAYGCLENSTKALFVLDEIRELLDHLVHVLDPGEG